MTAIPEAFNEYPHGQPLPVGAMRGLPTPKPDPRLAGLARWLGVDRNPLRRGTDRVEAALRLVMILLLVLAVPAAAGAGPRALDHRRLRAWEAEWRASGPLWRGHRS